MIGLKAPARGNRARRFRDTDAWPRSGRPGHADRLWPGEFSRHARGHRRRARVLYVRRLEQQRRWHRPDGVVRRIPTRRDASACMLRTRMIVWEE